MNWLHHLWFHYCWPSLQGNGPEDVISLIVVTAVGSLVWPPTRRRLHRFVDKKLEPVHEHLKAIRAHHEAHAESLKALHVKLDVLAKPKKAAPVKKAAAKKR